MTISNLVTGGQSFERPSVGAFFGKNPAGANDNVQRVSSDFLTKDILKTIVGAIDSIGKELVKLHDVSKNIVKSFDVLIKNTRDLNRDITKRFRDVNEQLNKSKIDFLRSIMTTPVPASDTPTTIGNLVKEAETGAPAAALASAGNENAGGSWLDNLLNFADTAKDIWDLTKKGGRGVANFLRPAVTGVGGLFTGIGVGGLALSAAATEMTKGEMGKQMYEMTADNPLAGAMAGDYALGAAIMHGPQKSEEDMAKEREALKDAPWYTRLYGIGKDEYLSKKGTGIEALQKMDSSLVKYWMTNYPEIIGAYSNDKIGVEDQKKIAQLVQDGKRTEATKLAADKSGIVEAAATQPKLADSKKNITSRNLAATIRGPEADKDIEEHSRALARMKKVNDNITADSQMSEAEINQKRIAGLALRYGLDPANVSATLEGGVPTAIIAGGKTIDVYNDLTEDERKKVQLAREAKTSQSGTPQQTAPTAPAAAPAGGGTEGAGGPDQKQQQATPPAPGGGTEGAGAPEKAPVPSGGGTGTGGGETPAGAPTPAAPAPAPSASSGGESGAGAGTAATTPAASAAGTAEGTASAGSPAATGAPEATPPAPSTPPAPPATPEPSSSNEPIVMNNNTTQNNAGSVGNSENAGLAGQNFPLEAQNDKIKEYLAKQNIGYQ